VREIVLTQGRVALVDDADYVEINRFKWHAIHVKGRWYAARNIGIRQNRRKHRMHTVLLGFLGVDHVNGDGLDNQRANLRAANQSENVANARKQSYYRGLPTSSRFKGVHLLKHVKLRPWAVQIKGKHVGTFATEVEAARAYNDAALREFGDFARLNEFGVQG